MEDLRKKLEEKRKTLHLLIAEIIEMERQFIGEEWKDKPECHWSITGVSEGMCPYGQNIRGMVYCKNPNCHK